MGALFIFILISVLIVSAFLFFNKGEKAQEIKSTLTKIYENFKELFSNFKKLFLIIKELIQSKFDQEPTQLNNNSTVSQSEDPSETEAIAEPEVTAAPEAIDEPQVTAAPEAIDEPEVTAAPEAIDEPETLPISELEKPSEDSIDEENIDIKTE